MVDDPVGAGRARIVLHRADRHWLVLHVSRLDTRVEIHDPVEWVGDLRRATPGWVT